MTDDEVRALVRAAIQKHLDPAAPVGPGPAPSAAGGFPAPRGPVPVAMAFARYRLPRAPDDAMCLIEPAARCNHCGYCQSHGH